ncbi:MAG: hypothetical protein ACRDL5_14575 [Solirubrobacteraceae bacterium]
MIAANSHEGLAFESHGVRLLITTDAPAVLTALPTVLPPGWGPCAIADVVHRFEVRSAEADVYDVRAGSQLLRSAIGLEQALDSVASAVRMRVAEQSPRDVFIHAGTVAHAGRAILLPGSTFAGKSTLVAALVRAGATYFSDEFAVIDEAGQVHPYATPIALRDRTGSQTQHAVESLGAVAGVGQLPVGLVALTTYSAGAQWQPERLSQATGLVMLASHAQSVHQQPERVLRSMSLALKGAVVLSGRRGEAQEVAAALLAELASLPL